MADSDHVTFTEGTFYQGHFDSRAYIKNYLTVSGECPKVLAFLLRCLHETFASGNLKGKKLIEIGCGPTVYCLISASKYFEEMVMSDFTDCNRREVEMWLKNEEGCYDWRPVIQFVCDLEGRSRSPEEVEQRMRQAVKQVLKCDVREKNPFHPLTMEPADCIVSSLCLESACKDQETYRRALGSIAALIKPGGALVLIGVLNETFYLVGQHRFSCLVLSQSIIEEILRDLGFSIKQVNIQLTDGSEKEFCDAESFFHLVAHKTK
ncbi:indolethylamine N-methyltransferase-like [Conger conger]|uniref:indolethylamine N-methyltransferase-like n=1 Tax=Conger conger TaxID=82655 RepID=UPI002A59B473|nr:indolethylamine N-methyltransferase-like [Conger conger]